MMNAGFFLSPEVRKNLETKAALCYLDAMTSLTRSTEHSGQLRLHYLDGLRGLAALYVTVHHAFLEVAGVPGWLNGRLVRATQWAWNGHIAVEIFIVLSGYSLMLPVARSGHLKDGIAGFTVRRARRILPPYYAALALSLVVIWLVPGMNALSRQSARWDSALPVSWGAVGSHLLMLQDFSREWITRIDPPMWTISQEWQIYFVFAIGLLPLWQRVGIMATVLCATLASYALHRIHGYSLAYASPEFLMLFAFGMLAASINFPGRSTWLRIIDDHTPWSLLTVAFWAVYVFLWIVWPDQAHLLSFSFALSAGLAVLCTLVRCTKDSERRAGHRPVFLGLFESDFLVWVGSFSYSLYLVHFPVFSVGAFWMHQCHLSGHVAVVVELLVAVPLAMIFAYGFHLVCEKPFMLGRSTIPRRAERAATLDAAP